MLHCEARQHRGVAQVELLQVRTAPTQLLHVCTQREISRTNTECSYNIIIKIRTMKQKINNKKRFIHFSGNAGFNEVFSGSNSHLIVIPKRDLWEIGENRGVILSKQVNINIMLSLDLANSTTKLCKLPFLKSSNQ